MAWPPGGSLGQDVAKSKNLARSPCVGVFGWLFGSIVFIQGGSFMQGFCCVFLINKHFQVWRVNMIHGCNKNKGFDDMWPGRHSWRIHKQQTAIWDEGWWVVYSKVVLIQAEAMLHIWSISRHDAPTTQRIQNDSGYSDVKTWTQNLDEKTVCWLRYLTYLQWTQGRQVWRKSS